MSTGSCSGCGATIAAKVCAYCGRRHAPPEPAIKLAPVYVHVAPDGIWTRYDPELRCIIRTNFRDVLEFPAVFGYRVPKGGIWVDPLAPWGPGSEGWYLANERRLRKAA